MCDSYKNDLFIKTPLIESIIMKDFVELNRIFLKLENTQPSGSFKLRGISRLCQYVSNQQYFKCNYRNSIHLYKTQHFLKLLCMKKFLRYKKNMKIISFAFNFFFWYK
jgi:hypothetical protein